MQAPFERRRTEIAYLSRLAGEVESARERRPGEGADRAKSAPALSRRRERGSARDPRLLGRDTVGAAAEGARAFDLVDLRVAEAEHLTENFLRVLAEQRRALHLAQGIRQLDRVADRDVLAAGRV